MGVFKNNRNMLVKAVLLGIILLTLFSTVAPVTTVFADDSNYKEWKQFEGDWANKIYVADSSHKFGDEVANGSGGKTVRAIGCYLVAMAIQIRHSGAKSGFTPWDFIVYMDENNAINSGGAVSSVEPLESFTDGNFEGFTSREIGDLSKTEQIAVIKEGLDDGFYPIIKMQHKNGGNHFVAIDSVEGDTVRMFDPGSHSTDLYEKYDNNGRKFTQVRFFQANGTVVTDEGVETNDPEEVKLKEFKWNSDDIPGMPSDRDWQEAPVPIIPFDQLHGNEKESIEKWKAEVEQDKNIGLVSKVRTGTMIVGFGVLILSLVYLVSFVFDRITITEFKAIEYLTKNKLSVSATGESTFFKGRDAVYPKLINTKDLIVLEVLMIGFSILLFSGAIYTFIGWVVAVFEFFKGLIF